MKRASSILAILLLLGIAIFSTYKYLSALKEKNVVLGDLLKARTKALNLEYEKRDLNSILEQQRQLNQELTQQNIVLQKEFEESVTGLAEKEAKLIQAQDSYLDLSSQIFLISSENQALEQENSRLQDQMIALSSESREYKSRLNSLAGLQKAFNDLRASMRRGKIKESPKERSPLAETERIKIEVFSPASNY